MTQREARDWDAFLDDLAALEGDTAVSTLLALDDQRASPPPMLRESVIGEAGATGRLARFATQVAELLDLSVERACAVLERVDDPAAWEPEAPGIAFLWVEGGAAVADCVRGFVRVAAGLEFPEHEHLGEEVVLVLQGSYRDSLTGELFRPGQIARKPTSSSHAALVPNGGPDLLKLAVIRGGVRSGDKTWCPR